MSTHFFKQSSNKLVKMKSDQLNYRFVIIFTITFCAVQISNCLPNPNSNNISENDLISKILQFWKEQDSQLNFGSKKDIVIFLGDTGTGKSALISLLTGDDLESVETYDGSETFRIIDKLGRVSQNSTILSKTLFPELIPDKESDVVYFDCPGFEDTRGIKYEITTAYLIRKLLESANSVKFVFVIAQNSVLDGGDRRGILNLARNGNSLVKNIEKFSDGIGLVVTKVENVAKMSKGKMVFVNDDTTLAGIRMFLSRAKHDFEILNRNNSDSAMDRQNNEGAIKLIEILLRNGTNGTPRIGLFRKPLETGSLNKMSTFGEERKSIKMMINQNLQYVPKDSNDFGFTLSAQSKLQANSLINEIGNRLKSDIISIGDEIVSFYSIQEEQSMYEIRSSVGPSNSGDFSSDKDKHCSKLLLLYNEASLLNNRLTETVEADAQLFLKRFVSEVKASKIRQTTELLTNIQKYMEYIQFLINLTKYFGWGSSELSSTILNAIQKMEKHLNRLLPKIERCISIRILDAYFRAEERVLIAESQRYDLIELKQIMFEAKSKLPIVGNDMDLPSFLKQIIDSPAFDKFDPSIENLINISATIDSLNKSPNLTISYDLSNEINKIINQFEASTTWYSFLIDLYEKMSEMNFKSNRYDQINTDTNELIEKCSIDEQAPKKNVSEIGLQKFLNDIDIKTNYEIETLQVNAFQLNALKAVLNATIYYKAKCLSDNSTIAGFNVKMSDIIGLECWNRLPLIQIFALDKVLFDIDIERMNDGNLVHLLIIAPVWKVMGNRRLNLSGRNGANFQSEASNGWSGSINGEDGMPGKPGFPGGYLYGVGNEFIGGSWLTIYTDGGNGGSGQDGGNGNFTVKFERKSNGIEC